jgi:hypothetical protein
MTTWSLLVEVVMVTTVPTRLVAERRRRGSSGSQGFT